MQWIVDIISSIIQGLYQVTVSIGFPSYALAIIFISILLKIALYPLTAKQMKSMKGMQEIQPKLQQIQKKYAHDKEKMNQAIMELYQEYDINPMAGCLPMLIQMPILLGLFTAIRTFEYTNLEHASFFWIPNITNPDQLYILPVLVGLAMFLQQKITMPKTDSNPTMKMMLYVMPVMIGWMSMQFPSGLCIYWVTFNILGIIQQLLINRPKQKAEEAKKEEVVVEEEALSNKQKKKAKQKEKLEASNERAKQHKN